MTRKKLQRRSTVKSHIWQTVARVEMLEPRRLLDAVPVGPEFQVNTYTTGTQSFPSLARDADGDFVIAWASTGQDGSQQGVYAQRYNAAGAPQGGEFRVNTHTTGIQWFPSAAMDADGDFVIAWEGSGPGQDNGIFAQRYNAAGDSQGAEFTVNTYTTDAQWAPSVAMEADGDFVIAWHSSGQDGSNFGVYAQRFNAAGVAQGAEFRVNTYTTLNQIAPSVAMDADGDFVVAWTDGQSYGGQDGSLYGVYAQRYNSAGQPQGTEFRVNSYTTNAQVIGGVAMDADGDFVITWMSYLQDGSLAGVYAQRYNAAGVPQGGEFRVNAHTTASQQSPSVAMDSDGSFVIAWYSQFQEQPPESSNGVFAKSYDAAGTPQGPEFRVNTYTTGDQTGPAIAMEPDGDFVIAWQSLFQDGSSYGVFAQRYAVADVVPPGVSSASLEFDDRQAVSVVFDEPLDPATVSANDMTALNLDNGSTPAAVNVILSAGNTVATWVFNTAGTFIADGDYTFTLAAGAISDVAGNPLAAQFDLTGAGIFFFAGDANRDRNVNLNDFNILAGNFGQTPRDFTQGDFDYSGNVNLNDFNILAGRFGQVLAAPQGRSSPLGGGEVDRDGWLEEILA